MIFSQYILDNVRPVLEYCVPLFNAGLTVKQSNDIESIQKRACKIIIGFNSYTTYENALELLKIPTLKSRREKLSLDFAISLEHQEFCQSWLPGLKTNKFNLRNVNKYQDFKCRTKRFQNSALPYLTRLLNCHHSNQNS